MRPHKIQKTEESYNGASFIISPGHPKLDQLMDYKVSDILKLREDGKTEKENITKRPY